MLLWSIRIRYFTNPLMKTIYTTCNWNEFNTYYEMEGWAHVKYVGLDYMGKELIRISKQVPNTISPLIKPYKNYIERLTQYSIRWVLSPISDFERLSGPFYDYYCLVNLGHTHSSWEEKEEYPYIIWCHGNDDFMWHKLLKTQEEGHEVIDYLDEEIDMPSLSDFLEAFGFIY